MHGPGGGRIGGGTWAAVPFKGLADPKQRLAGVLSPPERRRLADAMLADVLGALGATRGLRRVLLVSADPIALAAAPDWGAVALADRGPSGYNGAAEQAADEAAAAGASGLLIVAADLPLLRPDEVERILLAGSTAAVALAPDRHRLGTNALLSSPPGVLPYRFGLDSLADHRRAAEERGLSLRVLDLPGVGLDVDWPDDLIQFLQRSGGQGTATRRYLVESGLAERLSAAATRPGG